MSVMFGGHPEKATRPTLRLTYEDLVRLPEDRKRHELIDGEHFVTPSPNIRHQSIVGSIYFLIATYLEAHPLGRVFGAPLDVIFSDVDVVEPDVLYVSNERAEALAGTHVRGVPDLVVEVASRGTRKRDQTIKRRLYERVGVLEYWIVDPELEVVRVYRREGERFARVDELSREAGDVLVTTLLPGLEVPLSRVFRD
jgi:Uma2 family endonuclease